MPHNSPTPFRHLDNRRAHLYPLSGTAAYIDATQTTDADFHLRYPGPTGLSLSPEPQLIEVALVHRNGTTPLTGHYWAETLPLLGLISPLRKLRPPVDSSSPRPATPNSIQKTFSVLLPLHCFKRPFVTSYVTSPHLVTTRTNILLRSSIPTFCYDPFTGHFYCFYFSD